MDEKGVKVRLRVRRLCNERQCLSLLGMFPTIGKRIIRATAIEGVSEMEGLSDSNTIIT